MNRAWIVATATWGLLFLYSASVQFNDPDPWLWVPVYLVPAAMSLSAIRWSIHAAVPGAIAAGAGLWASWIAWGGIEESHLMKGFPQVGVFREELVREGLGLLLIAIWMTVIAIRSARSGRPGASPAVSAASE